MSLILKAKEAEADRETSGDIRYSEVQDDADLHRKSQKQLHKMDILCERYMLPREAIEGKRRNKIEKLFNIRK